jgi:4-hydroxy-tetrahydrodipicolinate synthase
MYNVKLHGIISTVVTPFNDDDSINEEMLRNEVRYLLDAQIHGICACGSTGEGNTLSAEESAQVCKIVVEEVGGKIPVVGGIIQNSTVQVIRHGKALKAVGVDVLQITPVHYLFTPDAEGTVDYYRKIGEELDMPIVIYNVIPWSMIPIEVVEKLAELPHIIGIKQSGGNMHLLADLLRKVKGKLSILAAIDDLHFPAFVMGVDGALAAIPTVTPHISVRLWNETQAGNYETAKQIHENILSIWRTLEGPNLPSRIKEALRLQGRPVGKARHPIQPVSAEEHKLIHEALKNEGLLAKEYI